MKITTTDGKEYQFIDMCTCCNLDTAGNHEFNCPLYCEQDIEYDVYVPMPPIKEYTIEIKITKIEKAKPRMVTPKCLKEEKC